MGDRREGDEKGGASRVSEPDGGPEPDRYRNQPSGDQSPERPWRVRTGVVESGPDAE